MLHVDPSFDLIGGSLSVCFAILAQIAFPKRWSRTLLLFCIHLSSCGKDCLWFFSADGEVGRTQTASQNCVEVTPVKIRFACVRLAPGWPRWETGSWGGWFFWPYVKKLTLGRVWSVVVPDDSMVFHSWIKRLKAAYCTWAVSDFRS